MNVNKKWTDEELEKLRKMSRPTSAPKLAQLMCRSRDSIKNKILSLNLPKFDPDYIPPPEPVAVPAPPKAPPKPAKKKVEVNYGTLEYCATCGAPVSNWAEHRERLGCRRPL